MKAELKQRRTGRSQEQPVSVIVIQPDEETHRKTIDGIARYLACMADEVLAWCQAHPEAVEAERKRSLEREARA